MKPYYQDSAVTIYHGDCRDSFWLTPNAKVDLLLTDPPYGIGKLMQGGKNTGHWNHLSQGNSWDLESPDIQFLLNAAKQQIVWGGNYFKLPINRCWLAWVKTNSVRTQADMELAWTNLDQPARTFQAPTGGSYHREHPTQKPLELMAWCISLADAPVVVLDPFMGSGTTLRAAKDLGRKAIGIEIEEKYCEIAAKRMAQEVLPFTNQSSPLLELPSLALV